MDQISNIIRFGTDGWRGVIADDFTFDNVRLCAQAVADYLLTSGLSTRGLLIGYDTRFASSDFARAAAEVIAANGIKTKLCSRATPTPVVSYGVMANKTGGAIVITASHNPGKWNGFKFKTENGASAPDNTMKIIEENISLVSDTGQIKRLSIVQSQAKELEGDVDLAPEYFRHIIDKIIDFNAFDKAKLKIVIDPMYGAGAGYLKHLLSSVADVVEINDKPNPIFPGIKQPEPIAINLGKLSSRVKEYRAHVGLATDGDADRVGVIDENGNFLTQLQVFAMLALYFLEVRGERGALVKTVSTTSMIDALGQIYHVPVFETRVGFKYVASVMLAQNALIGGEESGGYGFRGHIPERDGILSSLYFLDFMVKTGKMPSQLLELLYSKVGQHYYERRDLSYKPGDKQLVVERLGKAAPEAINGIKVAKKDNLDGFRFVLSDSSWLLIRFSGTEPLLRIYSESESLAKVKSLLDFGQQLTGL
jgi:alpha-D-glucose phosphate-specific phosphoglucomutase